MAFSLDTVRNSVIENIQFTPKDVLDIGSGDGKLLFSIKEKYPGVSLSGCDYTDHFLKNDQVDLEIVDLNKGTLPYEDESYDLITITEVAEHLENYHSILREASRILRKGGQIIITTPNILNLKSRIGFLNSGFWNLFGPLPLDRKCLESTSGHITPVHFFHLAYSLSHAGFGSIILKNDKIQKTSLFCYILLYPIIRFWDWRFIKIETEKFRTINSHNLSIAKQINSFQALTARSILVTANKK